MNMQIGNRVIGPEHPPFIIAELSGNHNQSLDTALAMIDAAAQSGVDAIKLQTYTADTMTIPCDHGEFYIDDEDSLWHGYTLHQLYQQAMTPWEWHEALFARAKEHGLLAFSTPFDPSSLAFLETLNPPCYKIASFENTDHPLLCAVAKTGKPVILSTGMASLAELAESVAVLRDNGCRDLILLKCTSHYPAEPKEANLVTLPHMASLFDCQVGLSDHSAGIGVAVAAVALGASVIEKHFVLDRSAGGIDAGFSLEAEEFTQLSKETRRAWQAMGKIHYGSTEGERNSLKHRRSLYITQDMQAGEILTTDNLRAIRPGLGLPTKYLSHCLGKAITHDVHKGTPMNWELI